MDLPQHELHLKHNNFAYCAGFLHTVLAGFYCVKFILHHACIRNINSFCCHRVSEFQSYNSCLLYFSAAHELRPMTNAHVQHHKGDAD